MGAEKRRPVYILLTLSEQIALVDALESLTFSPGVERRRSTTTNSVALGLGSLTEVMALLSVHCKPLLGPQNRASGPELMTSLSLIPVAECLRRVDSVVNHLDAQVSTYQRAFDQIYSQLERITNTMGNIVGVLERIEQERNEETRQQNARARQQGVVRCECGRMVSVQNGDEDSQEEKEDKEKADDDG